MSRLLRAALSALLALAACGSAFKEPRQDEATTIVWGLYDERNSLPSIDWPEGVPCDGHPHGLVPAPGVCAAGLTWAEQYRVEIIWLGSFSASAFAHELLHCHLRNLGVDGGDPNHERPEWGYLVNDANSNLNIYGL